MAARQALIFADMESATLDLSFALHGIDAAARKLLEWAGATRIITFSGGLGAGKTTLIHTLCKALGVKDAVSSPTFALINEYRTALGVPVLHMDWYRLRDAEEAVDAGMEDALRNADAYCFIEWPEKAPELLEDMPHIAISLHMGETPNMRRLNAASC